MHKTKVGHKYLSVIRLSRSQVHLMFPELWWHLGTWTPDSTPVLSFCSRSWPWVVSAGARSVRALLFSKKNCSLKKYFGFIYAINNPCVVAWRCYVMKCSGGGSQGWNGVELNRSSGYLKPVNRCLASDAAVVSLQNSLGGNLLWWNICSWGGRPWL